MEQAITCAATKKNLWSLMRRGNVSFGDTSKVQIQGKCVILIFVKNGNHKLVTNVYYVPKLKSNILSLGNLLRTDMKFS